MAQNERIGEQFTDLNETLRNSARRTALLDTMWHLYGDEVREHLAEHAWSERQFASALHTIRATPQAYGLEWDQLTAFRDFHAGSIDQIIARYERNGATDAIDTASPGDTTNNVTVNVAWGQSTFERWWVTSTIDRAWVFDASWNVQATALWNLRRIFTDEVDNDTALSDLQNGWFSEAQARSILEALWRTL